MFNNTQNEKKYWWPKISFAVGVLVILTIIVSFVLSGSPGPLVNPIDFLMEEIVFEEILIKTGIIPRVYYVMPSAWMYMDIFRMIISVIFSVFFYSFSIGLIVRAVEKKKILKTSLWFIFIILICGFVFVQLFDIAFFDIQCTNKPIAVKFLSVRKKCAMETSPYFTIPEDLFDKDSENMFDDIIITDDELNRIKKNGGNIIYFCQTGCKIRSSQCYAEINKQCSNCAMECYKEHKNEKNNRQGHILDLLKSRSAQECLYKCRM